MELIEDRRSKEKKCALRNGTGVSGGGGVGKKEANWGKRLDIKERAGRCTEKGAEPTETKRERGIRCWICLQRLDERATRHAASGKDRA